MHSQVDATGAERQTTVTNVKQVGRYVTVAHARGHEFLFVAERVNEARTTKLFAENWCNGRLPLDAHACRRDARVVAEQRFRDSGLI